MTLTAKKTNPNDNQGKKPRFATYQQRSALEIPAELEEHFSTEGYRLKWVRIIDPKTGGVDKRNINNKQRMGFEFVTHAELGSLGLPGIADLFEKGEDAKTKGWCCIGDVALAKRSEEIAQEHEEALAGEAWRTHHDIKRTILENQGIEVQTLRSTFGQKRAPVFNPNVGDEG